MPCRSRNPLPVSTRECTPSDSIAGLPVTAAAINFVAGMPRLPAMAAYTTAIELRSSRVSLRPAKSMGAGLFVRLGVDHANDLARSVANIDVPVRDDCHRCH